MLEALNVAVPWRGPTRVAVDGTVGLRALGSHPCARSCYSEPLDEICLGSEKSVDERGQAWSLVRRGVDRFWRPVGDHVSRPGPLAKRTQISNDRAFGEQQVASDLSC